MSDDRSIELEIEVPGTPEAVWAAIATGPGISSWYVPHQVEEVEGGAMSASFGPGMDVAGTVSVWEPPHRVRFEGDEQGPGLAFEWLVEAREGGSCVVRLVNSGFGSGEEWDDQYDAMTDGWRIFLTNLRLHLEHFAGQSGRAALPMAAWDTTPTTAWQHLTAALGVDTDIAAGDTFVATPPGLPGIAGTVRERSPARVSLVLTEPAPGTGFVAAEGHGPSSSVSIWLYLYGDDATDQAATCQEAWGTWLADTAP